MSARRQTLGQVAGARVADGDRGVRVQQQAGERPADQDRAPDDHRLGALRARPRRERAAPSRPAACRGPGPGGPGPAARRCGRQPVDVLGRVDRGDHGVLVDLRRAAEAGPGSRPPSSSAFSSSTSASSSSWEVEASSPWWIERIPTSSVCLRLLRDVDVRGGVVADEHRRQARGAAAACGRELRSPPRRRAREPRPRPPCRRSPSRSRLASAATLRSAARSRPSACARSPSPANRTTITLRARPR